VATSVGARRCPVPSATSACAGPRHARQAARSPYSSRNAAPPRRHASSQRGEAAISAPSPNTPSAVSTQSDTVQNATTGATCERASPWRSTSAFCVPIATISPPMVSSPCKAAEASGCIEVVS